MNQVSKELLRSNLNLKIQDLITEFETKTGIIITNVNVIRRLDNEIDKVRCVTVRMQDM